MAGEELLGILGNNDLATFNNSVLQSDPYGLAGRSLNAWQPNTSTWSPGTTAATAFGKAFLSGLLGNYAQQNAADQTNAVISVLPQLKSDPMAVMAPEGVDSGAFANLKANAVVRNQLAQAAQGEEKKSRMSTLLNAILSKGVESGRTAPDEAIRIASSDDPLAALEEISASRAATPTPTVAPIDNPLSNGKDSTLQKTQQYFQQFLSAGMPATQAATAAKEQVKGEIAANNKSFDEAKAAREYGQNLMSIANTARAGMGQAGQTGKFNTLARGYENIASLFGSQEASQQLAGDALLDSLGPEVIKMARPAGGGATSDFEARAYLGSGPSTSNTPEANALLVQKMENLGKLNMDYADFIEAYKEANAGSVVGASKKWNEYKQAFPVFKGEGDKLEINNDRPAWQEFFAQRGSEGTGVSGAVEGAQPVPTGQYTKSGKQIYILNGVKGVID